MTNDADVEPLAVGITLSRYIKLIDFAAGFTIPDAHPMIII
jgi:hypothetical protein